MEFPLPPSIIALIVLSLVCYIASVAWLLHAEGRREIGGLVILTIVAAVLRLAWIYDLPPGLNDDEVKTILTAGSSVSFPALFFPGIEAPILHAVLFQLPVTIATQSLFWGSRAYPLILGILSIPLAFVVGRSYAFSVRSSFVLAALVAVLPWSLFWGRLPWGGEILFYQTLLIAALARILWRDGGLWDALVGVVGLTGLLWEYPGAWCMVCMPLVAIVLAKGVRPRMYAVTILISGLLFWSPYLLRASSWVHYITEKVVSPGASPSWSSIPYFSQVLSTCRVFWAPVGATSWLSMHSAAIHPLIVLLAALLGVLTIAPRKTLFNLCGFLAGILTSSVSSSGTPSTHRIICAYLFIAISSAGALHALEKLLRGKRAGLLATIAALLFVGSSAIISLRIFVSDEFWRHGDGAVFLHGETLLGEALPLSVSDPVTVDPLIYRLPLARSGNPRSYKTLGYANWLPTSSGIQAFSRRFEEFIPLYREVVAPDHIRVFGGVKYPKSFSVRFDESEAKTLSSFGWRLTVDCKDGTPVLSFRVPTFMIDTEFNTFSNYCKSEHEYRYVATWVGPPTELKITQDQVTHVEILSPTAANNSNGRTFAVKTGEKVEIKVTPKHFASYVRLYRAGAPENRMPSIKSFVP
jgi:hypothetical protein